MSVVLSIDICQTGNCKILKFRETTGSYATLNTSGWGSPNQATSTATAATLTITDPDDNEYSIDLFTNGFPTTNPYFEYLFDSTSLGDTSSAAIPDGVYTFTYEVTTSTTTYTTTIQKLLYCNVQCCVYQMLAAIDDPECDCQKDAMESAIKAYNLLQGLKQAANCGLKDSFTELLEVLNRLCNNSNCQNCQ